MLKGLNDNEFYFLHSYATKIYDDNHVSATFDYDCTMIAAAEKANIFGVQFHPEKSYESGLKVLRNFGLT